MAPSGQKIVHIKHLVHFATSLSGLKVFQSPVKYATLDFQHTPAGEASFQLFSLLIQISLPDKPLLQLQNFSSQHPL
jgi:hypothetical protein